MAFLAPNLVSFVLLTILSGYLLSVSKSFLSTLRTYALGYLMYDNDSSSAISLIILSRIMTLCALPITYRAYEVKDVKLLH